LGSSRTRAFSLGPLHGLMQSAQLRERQDVRERHRPSKHEHSPVALSIYISMQKSLRKGTYSLSCISRELEHSPVALSIRYFYGKESWERDLLTLLRLSRTRAFSLGPWRGPRYARDEMFVRDLPPPNTSILTLLAPLLIRASVLEWARKYVLQRVAT